MPNIEHALELGQGEVAALFRTHDWAASPLGLPETWPQALRTVVGLMLNSKFPMFTAWGPELGFIYNDAYIDVLGQKHPAALGQPFRELWSELWDDVSPIVDKALAGEPSYFEDLPLTMLRKGFKEQTWFTFSYSPVYDDTGKVAGIYCACTETTQQILAERYRHEENERLKGFFQQAPGIIAVTRHANHTFEIANDAYYQLVGHRELIGRPVREALPEVEGQGFLELLNQVFRSGEPYRGRAVPVRLNRQHDDELEQRYVNFIYQPIRDLTGKVSGIFIEGSDVTEAVLANQALRESEQRLRQLANTIPHLAWMAQPDGSVHWFNDRFYEYTGTTLEQVEGWQWQRVYHPDRDDDADDYRTLIAKGEPFEMTDRLLSSTGTYRTFFTKVAPLYNSAGKIVQWFGTNTDIHEIENAQEELRAANRRKDEFLAMLAHELRNPLAPISTAAELLKLTNLDPDRVRATSSIISRQVAHMTDLVDDLLDVSRVTRGLVTLHETPVNINSVVVDAVEQVRHIANMKHQQLSITHTDDPVMVNGDRTRLIQIFSNILNNATRYTQDHGEIALRVSALPDQVSVSIRDNGIGIDPELLPHIFELFTQAERSPDRALGGLGLGLALVKSLVDLHRGMVSVRSEGANKGSEFTISLPRLAMETEISADDSHSGADSVKGDNVSVLVVDDNVDAAQTLCMLLETRGYHSYTEYTAQDALQKVRQLKPDIFILDIGLPDMDGFELARRLKDIPETTDSTFIALTGYGQDRDREQSKAAGFSHHLVKPVDIQRLLSVLAEAAARPL